MLPEGRQGLLFLYIEQGGFANAIILQAERDPDEEGDYMAFEQLMAEATAKREKKGEKKEDKAEKEKKSHRPHMPFGHKDGKSEEQPTAYAST